jgi:cytochrome c peroxidase
MKNQRKITLLWILLFVFVLSKCKKDQAQIQQPTAIGTPFTLQIPEGFPDPFIPETNPFTYETIELGRYIFYDKRLSRDKTMSCASCHFQFAAFTDGLPRSVGIRGLETKRGAMPIFNLAWQEHFFWDGRANSLEEQALLPIEDPLELDNSLDTVIARFEKDTMYSRLFDAAFGDPSITPERIANAISQFERTIVSANSEFDSVVRLQAKASFGNPLAEKGYEMFENENGDCGHCHGSQETAFLFGAFGRDLQFVNNGLKSEEDQLKDPGRELVSFDPDDRGKFKVPSVRNAALTSPFMHDGSIADLDSLLAFYEKHIILSSTSDNVLSKLGGLGQKNWSDIEKKELKAFIESLTDYHYLQNPEYADPF